MCGTGLQNEAKEAKVFDPDVIWTRNLLIWSQTRYRCATESHGNDLTKALVKIKLPLQLVFQQSNNSFNYSCVTD